MQETDCPRPLTAEEIVMLIEGLDAVIPISESNSWGSWGRPSEEELRRWAPYRALRARLKGVVHMSYYDNARGWLEAELRNERVALSERLHSRLAELLRDPKVNRRTLREGWVATMRELREVRQSIPRPLS